MKRDMPNLMRAFILALAAALAIGPASAEKPEWAGSGKGKGKSEAKKGGAGHGHGPQAEHYFVDNHRTYVREYYSGEFRAGQAGEGAVIARAG